MRRITFLGELAQKTSYGQISLEVIQYLQNKNYFVSVRSLSTRDIFDSVRPFLVNTPQPEPLEILISPPHHIPTPGKKVISLSMWESTLLFPHSIEFLNMASTVVTPCQWCADNFQSSGVTRPIHVVPLGIDPALFDYRPMHRGPCVFGAAGNLGNGSKRKGIADVIKIFQKEFPTEADVRLKLKCVGNTPSVPADDRIELTTSLMSDEQMADWYAGLTCFASMAKSEGFGLMQLQAMAVGRPVIASIYGGLVEFMDPGVGYPVGFSEVPAEEIWTGYGKWCQPDEAEFAYQMRYVYEHRAEVEEVGWLASLRAGKFTWNRFGAALLGIIEKEVC